MENMQEQNSDIQTTVSVSVVCPQSQAPIVKRRLIDFINSAQFVPVHLKQYAYSVDVLIQNETGKVDCRYSQRTSKE